MKKNLLLGAMVALSLAFTACSTDGEDVGNIVSSANSENAPTVKSLPTEALTLSFSNDSAPFKQMAFTETGKAVITLNKQTMQASPDDNSEKYLVGTYKVQKQAYTVYREDGTEYCILEMSSTRQTTINTTNVKIYLKSGSETDNEVYEGVAEISQKVASDDVTATLCREWTVATTRLRHKGSVTGIRQFDDPEEARSLNAILDYAKSVATINEEFDEGTAITSIEFTADGSFFFFFENGKHYIGKWAWSDSSKGYIKYLWDDKEMGNKFENGEAVFDVRQYKKTHYYVLTLGADIEDSGSTYTVELSFYLKEK